MMLLAFSRYVQAERESIDAEYDEDGNVILVKASDWHIAVDPSAFARAQEGDSQGFLFTRNAWSTRARNWDDTYGNLNSPPAGQH